MNDLQSADQQKSTSAANAASKSNRTFRIFVIVAALMSLLIGAAGWIWINRDQQPEIITIGTGPFGSDAYNLIADIQQIVLRHSDSLRIKVKATRDASQNIAMLNNEKIDAAVIRADTPVVATVRGIANLYPDVFQIIVRDDSNVYTIADLKNAKVSIPEFGSDGFRSFWVIGDHYDIPIDKMRWTAERFKKGAAKLLSGETDVFFTVRSLRDAPLIRLFEDAQLKGLKLRFIPIEQAEAISLKRPFLSSIEIPKGAFTGATPVPAADTPTSSVNRILVTRENVSASAIRELTKVMFENRLDLTIRFALASALNAPDQVGGLSVPVHEGAQSYYDRDQPSFIHENAEPIALIITILAGLFSGLLALRSRFISSQKNKADVYNYQLLDIQKQAMNATDISELESLKVELNNILQIVVVALDTDEVTDEGFQSFSLLRDAVRETISDRVKQIKS